MTRSLVTTSKLTAIANALRTKTEAAAGTTYSLDDMPAAIAGIHTGIELTASDEGKVVSSGALVAQTARSSEITANGTYDTTLNGEVTVNVSGGGGGVTVDPEFTNKTLLNPYYSQTYALVDGRIVTGFHPMFGFIAPYNGSSWMDFDWTGDWEIGVAFKVDTTTGNFCLFGAENTSSNWASTPSGEIIDGNMCLGISTNGSTWEVFKSIYANILVNKWYFSVMSYDSTTKKATYKLTEDFETWITDEDTLTANPYHSSSYKVGFGGLIRANGHTQTGACIDTYNTYIKENGSISWGCFIGSFPE